MDVAIALLGLLLILIILWDAFETIILPRRVTRRLRLTGLFYRSIWGPWSSLIKRLRSAKRRDQYLSLFGPLSLIFLLAFWAAGVILGYAIILWSLSEKLNATETINFGTYLYISGTNFFTLGYGDITPIEPLGRALAVVEAGTGFAMLAIVIGYLPVLYQAFSLREVNISLLDQRAGSPSSPAEFLRRHKASGSAQGLNDFLSGWERWAAELLESHLSYPVLCYFRSQHDNQSWLAAMTTLLDTCAVVIVCMGGSSAWQARLTFAMARHAIVDIAQVFRTAPTKRHKAKDRLSHTDFQRLIAIIDPDQNSTVDFTEAEKKLTEMREMYEPYVAALSELLVMPLPPWILSEAAIDNWKTSAWGRIQ
ncbi:MAG TPA: potassium channel family protein [Pyrinomonadaceae bacterium]|nr:potassium channel family protein [Pyrinomonadaceae bacterium]